MAGPTCIVLSTIPCTEKDLIEEVLRLTDSSRNEHQCNIANTYSIGGRYRGESRPFVWFREPRDSTEVAMMTDAFRVTPALEIGLAAMCNQAVDHQVLGEVALWLAEKTCGFVDLCGSVELPQSGLPGEIILIPYEMESGDQGESMVMDRVAFRAWLGCPQFRMVK